ncbi:MAG: ATP-binding protein [Coriobacteriia bacterium]|nr:ATP-binding protein [Coriobacteriia bacterium]
MIKRDIEKTLLDLACSVPILSVTGPRQSGKTTLIKSVFNKHEYLNLENPAMQNLAKADPVAFLKSFSNKLIIDEAQYVPEIFSAVQVLSDIDEKPGAFILSGSQNFLLSKNIKQSLAGRVAVVKLLPLSFNEIKNHFNKISYKEIMIKGEYPRLYDTKMDSFRFYRSYINTYIARDVKDLLDIRNTSDFLRLLSLLACRAGQLLNYASLGKELAVDVRTIKSWISVLESSYIIYHLRPHYKNLTKTMVKSPKVYFYDTGLMNYLLNIKNNRDFELKGYKGQIFENFVMSELMKYYYNDDSDDRIAFYRDKNKLEIDIVDNSYDAKYRYCEVKAGETYQKKFNENIKILSDKDMIDLDSACVVYGGIGAFKKDGIQTFGFKEWSNNLYS